MTEPIAKTIVSIIVTVLLALFSACIYWYIRSRIFKKNRMVEACKIFRDKIRADLKGLYPVTKNQHWDKGVFPRFSASIPTIESAAAEFRLYVSRKAAFDHAVKEYCDYCRKITWEETAAMLFTQQRMRATIMGQEKNLKK